MPQTIEYQATPIQAQQMLLAMWEDRTTAKTLSDAPCSPYYLEIGGYHCVAAYDDESGDLVTICAEIGHAMISASISRDGTITPHLIGLTPAAIRSLRSIPTIVRIEAGMRSALSEIKLRNASLEAIVAALSAQLRAAPVAVIVRKKKT